MKKNIRDIIVLAAVSVALIIYLVLCFLCIKTSIGLLFKPMIFISYYRVLEVIVGILTGLLSIGFIAGAAFAVLFMILYLHNR